MSHPSSRRLAGAALVLALAALPGRRRRPAPSTSRTPRRRAPTIPDEYQWNAGDIFADEAAWEAEMTAIAVDIPKLNEFKGRLGESAATMLDAQNATFDTMKRLYKLYVYAQVLYDVNQGDGHQREMQGRVAALMPAFGEATSWMQPELLEIDPAVIRNFMAEDKELAVYDYYFEELWRQKANTLSSPEERLMALTGNMRSTPGDAHESLLGVDMKFPEIVNAEGKKIPVTVSGFSALRSSDDATVRGAGARRLLRHAARLREHVRRAAGRRGQVAHHDQGRARLRDLPRGRAVARQHQPRRLPHAHLHGPRRTCRARCTSTSTCAARCWARTGPLTFPNLYNAHDRGRRARVHLRSRRARSSSRASSRWARSTPHCWPRAWTPATAGSMSTRTRTSAAAPTATASWRKDIHPYVLHNFDNSLDAVSTTAHEMGHALHSVFSSRNQPPVYAGYTTFLAEVASTCNEAARPELNEALKTNQKSRLLESSPPSE